MYLRPVLKFGKRAGALHDAEFVWIIGAMVALSFYEGAYSAALVVALALLHAQAGESKSIEDTDTTFVGGPTIRESVA